MFQTLQPESFRVNKTSIPGKRRKINLDFDLQSRPNTVEFPVHYSSIGPKQNLLRTVDHAQLELTNSFKNQMSPYIKQKIRSSLSRNHQRRVFFSRTSSYLDDPEQQMSQIYKTGFSQTLNSLKNSSNFNKMKICIKLNQQLQSPIKQRQLISDSIITNTKQRIDRLIGMKRQKEKQYQDLKKSIQKKCFKLKGNNLNKMSFFDPKSQNKLPTMETLQWDQQWKQQLKKESNRYRNRLIAKHKRDMSMKIHIPQNKSIIQ